MEITDEELTKIQASGTMPVDEYVEGVCNRAPAAMPVSEPTVVPHIIFSNLVIREHGTGKLSLIGTFQHFFSEKFPFLAPNFFITVTIANFIGKLESEKVTVRVEQPDSGVVICSVGAEINSAVELRREMGIEVPFPMPQMVFPSAGIYEVVVLMNNDIVGKRQLVVMSRTSTNQPQT